MSLAEKLKREEQQRRDNEVKAKEAALRRVEDIKALEEKFRREEYERSHLLASLFL